MELTWYGLGCFRMSERGYPAVVTDPFAEESAGLSLPRGRADIVTTSEVLDEPERAAWKGLRGVERTLAGPGEYEIGGLFISGVATPRNRKRGAEMEINVVYAVDLNGVVVCHLGESVKPLTQAQIEALGHIHVLLLPVGLPGGLTPAMASEVVSSVEPNIVVPMNYKMPGLQVNRNPVDRFLKEMGMTQSPTESSLKLTASTIPDEPTVILLEPQKYD